MELPINDLLVQIGEMAVENRAIRQTLDSAVRRIQQLEGICAAAGIQTEVPDLTAADVDLQTPTQNGNANYHNSDSLSQ